MVAGEGDGEGEEYPGLDVVDSGGGHGGLADRGGEQLELGEDADEDGEGGDGDGHPHAHQERHVGDLVRAGDGPPDD